MSEVTNGAGEQQGEEAAANGANPRRNRMSEEQRLLVSYGVADLPEVFAMREPNGEVLQESDPCFQCTADGFYGQGLEGTWYMEGAIIVLDGVPNEHLKPLNRAAGLSTARWLASLPQNKAYIDIGDMSEAAQMLAKDPSVTDLPPAAYQQAVIKVAEELKLRREGKNARVLPSIGHNFAPTSGAGAKAPMLGARMSDMSQLTPGQTRTAMTGAGAVPGARAATRKAVPALGGTPPR